MIKVEDSFSLILINSKHIIDSLIIQICITLSNNSGKVVIELQRSVYISILVNIIKDGLCMGMVVFSFQYKKIFKSILYHIYSYLDQFVECDQWLVQLRNWK